MAVGLRKRSEVPKTEPRNIIEEFTDREDPQEAFERKFRAFSADWRENIGCVLCYYGIGGLGKTSLINKLRRLIQSNHADHFILSEKINCHSILYDFDGKEKDILHKQFQPLKDLTV